MLADKFNLTEEQLSKTYPLPLYVASEQAGTKDSFSHGKRSSFICKIFSLFLQCNMAAVQNLYRRRQKENRRKSNERKKKRYENNAVERVYGACVGNPPGNDLAECILYLPSLVIPKEFVNVEDAAELLLRRDAPYIAQLLHQAPSAMQQEAN